MLLVAMRSNRSPFTRYLFILLVHLLHRVLPNWTIEVAPWQVVDLGLEFPVSRFLPHHHAVFCNTTHATNVEELGPATSVRRVQFIASLQRRTWWGLGAVNVLTMERSSASSGHSDSLSLLC